MTTHLEKLKPPSALPWAIAFHTVALGEVTLVVKAADYYGVMQTAARRSDAGFRAADRPVRRGLPDLRRRRLGRPAFCRGVHLLSVKHNWRVRVRVFAPTTTCRCCRR
jgi:NADH-quinone oxidoreductase subunit C